MRNVSHYTQNSRNCQQNIKSMPCVQTYTCTSHYGLNISCFAYLCQRQFQGFRLLRKQGCWCGGLSYKNKALKNHSFFLYSSQTLKWENALESSKSNFKGKNFIEVLEEKSFLDLLRLLFELDFGICALMNFYKKVGFSLK